ncbi:MAG TPA: hypothetical protein VGG38_17620 [Acidimicrobiales bacterium]
MSTKSHTTTRSSWRIAPGALAWALRHQVRSTLLASELDALPVSSAAQGRTTRGTATVP